MKTTLAAASFALIVALSGLSTAHAGGFNDRGALPNVASTRSAPQNLSHVPVVHGFNQQSHHAKATDHFSARSSRAPVIANVHCDLPPRLGFNNSTSFASC